MLWLKGEGQVEGWQEVDPTTNAIINAGHVLLSPRHATKYELSEEVLQQLIVDFYMLGYASLSGTLKEQTFKHFVRHYGLLWHGYDNLSKDDEVYREPVERWCFYAAQYFVTRRLSLWLGWAIGGTASQKKKGTEELRRWFGGHSTASADSLLNAAGERVAEHVNLWAGYQNVSFKWTNNPPHFAFQRNTPKSLIELVAVNLSEAIAHNHPQIECEHCKKIVFNQDRRAKYCSVKCRDRANSQKYYLKKTAKEQVS